MAKLVSSARRKYILEKQRLKLSPHQQSLVSELTESMRTYLTKYPEGVEGDLEVFGPPEAYYHPAKNWNKLS